MSPRLFEKFGCLKSRIGTTIPRGALCASTIAAARTRSVTSATRCRREMRSLGDIRVNGRGLGLQPARFCRSTRAFAPAANAVSRATRRGGWGNILLQERFVMRRVSAICAAAGIAISALAVAPAQAGYYVIRWENTGICQIWNEDLKYKPMEWPSHYKVVSKPVATFTDATAIQLKMREQRHCTL